MISLILLYIILYMHIHSNELEQMLAEKEYIIMIDWLIDWLIVYLFFGDDIGEEDGEELMQDKNIEESPS